MKRGLAEYLLMDSAAEALKKRLVSRHTTGSKAMKRFRSNAEGIFQLGGVEGLELWLEARVNSGIGSEDEMEEISKIHKKIATGISGAKTRLIREWKADEERKKYEMTWVELLNRRDLNQRAAEFKSSVDPRQAILKRLKAAGVVA